MAADALATEQDAAWTNVVPTLVRWNAYNEHTQRELEERFPLLRCAATRPQKDVQQLMAPGGGDVDEGARDREVASVLWACLEHRVAGCLAKIVAHYRLEAGLARAPLHIGATTLDLSALARQRDSATPMRNQNATVDEFAAMIGIADINKLPPFPEGHVNQALERGVGMAMVLLGEVVEERGTMGGDPHMDLLAESLREAGGHAHLLANASLHSTFRRLFNIIKLFDLVGGYNKKWAQTASHFDGNGMKIDVDNFYDAAGGIVEIDARLYALVHWSFSGVLDLFAMSLNALVHAAPARALRFCAQRLWDPRRGPEPMTRFDDVDAASWCEIFLQSLRVRVASESDGHFWTAWLRAYRTWLGPPLAPSGVWEAVRERLNEAYLASKAPTGATIE